MKYLFLILFTVSLNAQILPSQQATHYKKNSVSSDTWDSPTKGNYISISGNSATSTYSPPSHTWRSVYGSTGITSGIMEWEITIDQWTDTPFNFWELIIGVSYERSKGATYLSSGNVGVGYISQNGKKTNGGNSATYGASYGQGDVIKIQLNMNNGELKFYLNGDDQGVSHTLDTSKTWYLAASIGNSGTQISITG